jgi:TRAP-type C4-dicarboxylate transport system permease small subunit
MDRLLQWARFMARAGTWFGGGLVLLAAFVISADVLMRKLFDTTLGGASEISGYVLAISTTWSLALALIDRAHVRIDSLYALLPTRICALLDIFALLSFMIFSGILTWEGWIIFAQSVSLDAHSLTPLATPLAYPQFLWVAGFGFFFVVMLLLLARALMTLVTGDIDEVRRLLGSRTALQELEEAMREHEQYKDA